MTQKLIFTCPECQEEKPASALGTGALRQAGTSSRAEALVSLDQWDHVCERCQGIDELDLEDLGDQVFDDSWGRSDNERWLYSGLHLTQAQKTVIMLNY